MTIQSYEERIKRLTRINATHLKNSLLVNEGAALEVASCIGRFVTDAHIMVMIRASRRKDSEMLFALMDSLVDTAVNHMGGEKAEAQAEKYGAGADDVAKLLQESPMCIQDMANRLLVSPDRIREILKTLSARVVDWEIRDGNPIRLYGLAQDEKAEAACTFSA